MVAIVFAQAGFLYLVDSRDGALPSSVVGILDTGDPDAAVDVPVAVLGDPSAVVAGRETGSL